VGAKLENRLLRRIFRPEREREREKVKEEVESLCKEDLHNLFLFQM
jgi:hypothetical protein